MKKLVLILIIMVWGCTARRTPVPVAVANEERNILYSVDFADSESVARYHAESVANSSGAVVADDGDSMVWIQSYHDRNGKLVPGYYTPYRRRH